MVTTTLHEAPEVRYSAVTAEIARLANSDVSADAFVKGLLEQTLAVLGAKAAGLWGFSSQGVLALAGEKNLAEIGVTRDPAQSRLNVRRLLDVTASQKSILHDAGGEFRGQTNGPPVLMAPVATTQRCVGVFEVFWDRPLASDEALDAQHFVETVCSSTVYFLAWREESFSTELIREFWDRFDQTTARLHGSLDLPLVAMTAVNEGRRLLNCDRLSLVIRHGSRTKVLAVSGQEEINPASNLVRSLAELAELGIAANRELGTGDDISIPAAIEKAVLEHVQVGGARLVRVVPLRPPQPADTSKKPAAVPRAFAALVFEQFTEAWLSPLAADRLARYATHVAGALHNAQTHHHIFLLALRQAIGRIGAKLAGRPLAKLALAGLVLAAAGTAAAYVQAPYRIEGKGKLMPAVQSSVFAPWDGEVTAVYVAGGQHVDAGQPLAQLHNDELQAQLLTVRNRAAEKRQQLEALQAEIGEANRRTMSPDDFVRLRGRLAQTRIELEDARERGDALDKQIELLTIRAPITGTVASFQVERTLLNRPVRRGELLIEVMDEEADWRLEVAIPEQRLGHLFAAQTALPDGRLPVEFALGTTPEETYHGEVELIASRTNTTPDQGAVIDVHIAVNAAEIKNCRIGAEAIAKIDCGRKSVAYVLFGDAVEFVQRKLW
jgi:multidrug efflux pump subunit AcrA (membrane-fusion protein)